MKELLNALKPVKNRLRRNRALRGAAFGFAAGAAAALALRILSLVVYVPDKWIIAGAAVAAAAALGAAGNALRPVGSRDAACAADRCGLQERAQTALEIAESPDPDSETGRAMRAAQAEDACAALKRLDPRAIRPGSVKRPLLCGLAACLLCAGTLLIPGRPDRLAEQRKILQDHLAKASAKLEQAEKADETALDDAEKSELRKLTEDLKRDLRDSRDETDALVALDRAEKRLEELRSRTAADAAKLAEAANALSEALKAAGLDSLAEAVSSGDAQALAEALAGMDAEAAEALAEAAEGLSGEAKAAAEAMASARNGDAAQAAAQALQALQAGGAMSASAMSQALQSLKASLGGAGSSGSQGQGGSSQGAGSGSGTGQAGGGAGRGTTNEEQKGGGSAANAKHVNGTGEAEYREGQYERIYDPEQLDMASRDVMTEQNRLGEDSVQIQAGEGKGTVDGTVPVGQVLGEYAQAEARSADSENLTGEQREWVREYFRILTEQNE